MTQRILNVQVRPFRVAVLIANNASQDDVLLSLKFLSSLWGGRYCQLLAVEPSGDDPLACNRLSQIRPDLVYGVAIDRVAWNQRVREACQPRGFGILESNYVENLHRSIEQHVTATHVIHHIRQTPSLPGRPERTLRIFGCNPNSSLRPFVGAIFGMHYEHLRGVIPYEGGWFPDAGKPSDLIALHSDVTSKYHQSWLDLTSHGLTVRSTLADSPPPPTIVIVDSLASDLALFWNLRQGTAVLVPQWVIPLPANALSDSATPGRLKEWLQLSGRGLPQSFSQVASCQT